MKVMSWDKAVWKVTSVSGEVNTLAYMVKYVHLKK